MNEILKKYYIQTPTIVVNHKGIEFETNEYTVRNLQIAITKGEISYKDITFNNVSIDENGIFAEDIKMDLNYQLSKELIKINCNKNK